MFEVGRLVTKIKGRDSGKNAVIVMKNEGSFVTIDGDLKRKKCSINHLIPQGTVFKIAEGASTETIRKLLSEHQLLTAPKKKNRFVKKERTKKTKPKKQRKNKE